MIVGAWGAVWRFETGLWTSRPVAHAGTYDRCACAALSPCGTLLARIVETGPRNAAAFHLHRDNPVERLRYNPVPLSEYATHLFFSPDGQFLYALGAAVFIHDAASGTLLRTVGRGRVFATRAALSPDGRLVAWRANDAVRVIDIETDRVVGPPLLQRVNFPEGGPVAFSADGRILLVGDGTTVRSWDVATWAELPAIEPECGWVASLACSRDGMLAAAGGNDGRVAVWDLG
jgi:WD40 repeat protein